MFSTKYYLNSFEKTLISKLVNGYVTSDKFSKIISQPF